MLISKIPFCIQARLGSSRLPGKILLELEQKSILNYLIDRLEKIKKKLKLQSKIYVLVPKDEFYFFQSHVNQKKAKVFGGSHLNLAKRYFSFCKEKNFNYVWRITSDNPFLAFEPFEIIINYIKKNSLKDPISLYHQKQLPNGNIISLLNYSQLRKICKFGNLKEKEHIILKNKYINIKNPEISPKLTRPKFNMAINNINDYYKLKKYFYFLNRNISLKKILENKNLVKACSAKKKY